MAVSRLSLIKFLEFVSTGPLQIMKCNKTCNFVETVEVHESNRLYRLWILFAESKTGTDGRPREPVGPRWVTCGSLVGHLYGSLVGHLWVHCRFTVGSWCVPGVSPVGHWLVLGGSLGKGLTPAPNFWNARYNKKGGIFRPAKLKSAGEPTTLRWLVKDIIVRPPVN